MATRSSSACVALINMRFMVVPCALSHAERRGVSPGYFVPPAAHAQPRPGFPALRHHGGPRERLYCSMCCRAGGDFKPSLQAGTLAPRGTCSELPASDVPGGEPE